MPTNADSRTIQNPFPGLRPFETDEYRLFFGREGQSDELITRLERTHFLAIVGTSGSGKSSLVRAGLLPALRGGLMAGAGSGWRISVMRPGNDPIGNLAAALADKDVLLDAGGNLAAAEAEAVIEATLRSGSLGLVEAAKRARLGEHEKLLIVVDQFEELFRFRAAREYSSTGDDASAFVKLLLEASQQRELQIYVVPTMRSDFLGDCAQFQGLPEAINDGQYLIPRMTRDERRFAISGPVGVTRGKITEPLVNRLMNDVGDNPDQLPILQHALMRTWDYWAQRRRNGEPIGLEHYEAVGTMSDALSLHADEAFNELPDERSRLIAEKLFKALTEQGMDNRETRRPLPLHQLCSMAGASEVDTVAVIDTFRRQGRSFLMPAAGISLLPDTIIDISHESLIRNWQRLKTWVNEEAQSARIYRRLAEAAILYQRHEEGLLAGPFLQIALDWRENQGPNRVWAYRYNPEFETANKFLDESRQHRDEQLAAEERQHQEQIARERRELEQAQLYAEQQRRAAQRLRRFTFALVLISLIALLGAGAAVVAFTHSRKSESQARTSEALAKASEARAQKLATDLQQSLGVSVAAEKTARDEKGRAIIAEHKEEDARRDAQEKARVAEQQKIKAQSEKKRAETAQAAELFARETNQSFRHGSAYRQQGEQQKAVNEFSAAVEGFKKLKNFDGMADTYVALGELSLELRSNGEGEEGFEASEARAVKYLDAAAAVYRNNQNHRAAAEAFAKLGDALTSDRFSVGHGQKPEEQRKVDELREREGVNRYEKALVDFEAAGAKTDAKEMLEKISTFYENSTNEADRRKAIWAYQKMVASYLNQENYPARRNLFIKIAKLYFALNEKERCIEYVDEALAVPGDAAETRDPVNILIDIGVFLAEKMNDPEDARFYFDKAAKVRENGLQQKDDQSIEDTDLFIRIGKLFSDDIKDKATAIQYFERALQIYRQGGDREGEAKALGEIANWFTEGCKEAEEDKEMTSESKANCDLAIQYFRKEANITQPSGDQSNQFYALFGIANVYEQSGDRQKALAAYTEALALSPPSGTSRVKTLRKIANLQHELQENQQALTTYNEVLALYEAARNENLQAFTYSEIGKLLAGMKQPQEAIDSYQKALLIYDRSRSTPETPSASFPQEVQSRMFQVYRAMKRQQPK